MKASRDRILTTHAGSLPRPDDLLEMVQARAAGRPGPADAYAARLTGAVADIVARQRELGVDVVDDGEMSKPGFIHYVNERLGGFEPSPAAPAASTWAGSREVRAFPEFYEWFSRAMPSPAARALHLTCTGPIVYKGQALVKTDLENLRAALLRAGATEAFVPAVAPSNVADWQKNLFYRTEEEYITAIGEAMREEYRAIVDAGFVLQIDDPRLVTYYVLNPGLDVKACRKWCRARVDLLNHALRGIPEDRIRFHTCYGINIGPRIHDMELRDVVDIILRVRAGAYSFEAANPRHEHEWRVWEDVKVPAGKILIPGVITQSSVLVEHPELVAQRIERFASVVGRERVIAGSDCGFATFAGSPEIHPTVVWAKLAAMAEGARIASRRLWRSATKKRRRPASRRRAASRSRKRGSSGG